MNKLMIAMAVVLGLGVTAPVFAAQPDSGSVGTFTQWQRAPAPR